MPYCVFTYAVLLSDFLGQTAVGMLLKTDSSIKLELIKGGKSNRKIVTDRILSVRPAIG